MEIKMIKNDIIPPKGYKAMTIWPFIFHREELSDVDVTHETIHAKQQLEMLIMFFYLWYIIEWLIRLVLYRDRREAYRNISFEQEAYMNEIYDGYPEERRCFRWVKYLNTKTYRRKI